MQGEETICYDELSLDDCLSLLARSEVGRVGVNIEALPAVLPVNFVLVDDHIVFRTAPGTKLNAATAGSVVAFEVDGYDAASHEGWSVLVRGVAGEVTDPEELARMQALPLDAWALDGAADRFVRVPPTVVTGRRIRRSRPT